jgi:hypothetical protein
LFCFGVVPTYDGEGTGVFDMAEREKEGGIEGSNRREICYSKRYPYPLLEG